MSESASTAAGTPSPAAVSAAVPSAVPAAPTPSDLLTAATGDDAVDEALGRLREVQTLDLRAQLATFEAVHEALQDRLADAEG
ncbi:hypothetical protein GC089_10315 [Cellulomonas sp. JZ18]|uniref:hypothetical protein n=1 Tax=Cellulomonas sp. JZ18 TaxID=2654191 RepID=UPI0012D403A7|nr:hypothetical protein [Cellulomonas sp. JZ18]QGQ19551.1 hypothetical protein GC089_10315 [Cellulomonas sp. JZ18]